MPPGPAESRFPDPRGTNCHAGHIGLTRCSVNGLSRRHRSRRKNHMPNVFFSASTDRWSVSSDLRSLCLYPSVSSPGQGRPPHARGIVVHAARHIFSRFFRHGLASARNTFAPRPAPPEARSLQLKPQQPCSGPRPRLTATRRRGARVARTCAPLRVAAKRARLTAPPQSFSAYFVPHLLVMIATSGRALRN
jgi:hypothetical protein